MPRSGPIGPIRNPAPLAMVPLRGFGGDGAGFRRNRKGSSNVARQNPQKDRGCARREPRKKACEAWEHSLGFDPQRGTKQEAVLALLRQPKGQRSPPS